MKRLMIAIFSICFLVSSGCAKESGNSSEKESLIDGDSFSITDESLKEDETPSESDNDSSDESSEIVVDSQPFEFFYDGKLHNISSHYDIIYDGGLVDFDYSLLDGYVFLGVSSGSLDGSDEEGDPSHDFEANYFLKEGTPILYNEQTNSFLFWMQEGRTWLEVWQHNCTPEKCLLEVRE